MTILEEPHRSPKLDTLQGFVVCRLGRSALRFLELGGRAYVLGVTSKGAFLQNDAGQVVFLSQERFRGPLTINLHENGKPGIFLHLGQECQISQEEIIFPNCRIVISEEVSIWEPALIEISEMHIGQKLKMGMVLLEDIVSNYEDSLFWDFLYAFQDNPREADWVSALNLIPSGHGEGGLLANMSALLGLGGGLTPAGDDFICGFLLVFSHLQINFWEFSQYTDVLTEIVTKARQRTTALSATLIASSADGQADERLINLLRWLLTGKGDLVKIKEELLSYGNSSGVDTFAGMLAALLFFQDKI